MELKRIFGTLFFPETDEKLEHVWLNISDDRIHIEIPYTEYGEGHWPVLYGEFNGLDSVTFVNCTIGGGNSGAGGSFRNLNISYVIQGFVAKKIDDVKFKSIILRSPALKNWIIQPNFIKVSRSENKTITLPKWETIISTKHNGFRLEISIGYPFTQGSYNLIADKECSIQITFDKLESMDRIYETIRLLQKLVLFLTYKNPEFDLYVVSDGSRMSYELIKKKEPLRDGRFTQQVTIHYSDVKDQLDQIVKKWFENKKFHPIMDLVLQKCYNPEMSIPAYFLNVCVALESFHRRFGKGNNKKVKSANPENKLKIQKLIEASHDTDLLTWFNEKATEWEKPELKLRLREFEETIAIIFKNFTNYSVEEIITKTVQSRNDLAHEGESLKRFKSLFELFIVTKGLEYAVRLELMSYLGVDIKGTQDSFLIKGQKTLDILIRLNKRYL